MTAYGFFIFLTRSSWINQNLFESCFYEKCALLIMQIFPKTAGVQDYFSLV